jgi:hypothetical protein
MQLQFSCSCIHSSVSHLYLFSYAHNIGQTKLTDSCSIVQDHPTHSPLGQGTPYNYGLVAGGARTR